MKSIKQIFSNRNILVIAVTSGLWHFAHLLWIPWLPLYLQALGALINEIGLTTLVSTFLMICSQLLGGFLADRFGRKRVILLSNVGLLGPLTFLFAKTWQQLIPGIIINSFNYIRFPAFQSLVVESTPFRSRAVGLGVLNMITLFIIAATNVAGGVLIASIGTIEGMRLAFIIDSIISLIILSIRLVFLSETLKPQKSDTSVLDKSSSQFQIRKDLLSRSIFAMLITQIFFNISIQALNPFIVIYVTQIIGLTTTQWGLTQMILQLTGASLAMVGGHLSDRFGRRPSIILTRVFDIPVLVSYLFLRDFNSVFFINIICGLGAGLGGGSIRNLGGAIPGWTALIADLVPAEKRGRVQGMMMTIAGLASLPSSYVGGYIWETYTPGALLLTSSMFAVISLFVFTLFVKEPKERAR